MEKKYLNKTAEKILSYLAIFQVLLLLTLSDFTLRSLPLLVLHFSLTALNIYILYNHSRRFSD